VPVSEATLKRYGITIEWWRAVHHFLRKNASKKGHCTNRRCGREGKTYWSLRPGKAYVKDVGCFRELCASCAALVDSGGTLTKCRNGHSRDRYTYVDSSGGAHCYLCITERNRGVPVGSLKRLPRPLKVHARPAKLGRPTRPTARSRPAQRRHGSFRSC
jgi:hypothetical protein